MRPLSLILLVLTLLLTPALGQSQKNLDTEGQVSVYVSLDEEHSSKILKLFESETGIKVRYNPDTEDNKTVGLVNKILAEGDSPVADVFWNNECGQSERLRRKGRLEPYESPSAAAIGARFRGEGGAWTGFAARRRVLIWNREKIKLSELPKTLEELAEPRFASRLCMAKPLTGTTMTHAGALYAAWGVARTEAWFGSLQKNGTRFERGNAQVARLVADGEFPFGLTDTDDVHVRRLEGKPVDDHYLDVDGMGTLCIPNSLMILKGARHPKAARALLDFLLTPRIESMLATGPSAQIPLHPGVPSPPHVLGLDSIRSMDVSWSRVGEMIEAHARDLERRFQGGGAASPSESSKGIPAIGFALAALVLGLVFAFLALKRPRGAGAS